MKIQVSIQGTKIILWHFLGCINYICVQHTTQDKVCLCRFTHDIMQLPRIIAKLPIHILSRNGLVEL